MLEWAVVGLLMLAHSLNTFDTINRQKDTQHALDVARAEANQRHRDLEIAARLDGLTGILNRFVADLGHDPAAEVLIRGFLSIEAGLGVTVIAEGIETDAQLAHLRRLNCVFGQGWRFGKATPLEETRIKVKGGRAARECAPAQRHPQPRQGRLKAAHPLPF